ncbi:hypothetical protein PCANC_07438 [Puccinia coronata f. sp. avenae]|uniref:Uncharacterized protein n=1 Tax=Puccinia coronata f. sp. avenae TaxID=200324 RepID=A0A2N5T447_9BASI|nr:hypothetical protein PCANC_07438 [Puccinia coronata f. sp. avenae]
MELPPEPPKVPGVDQNGQRNPIPSRPIRDERVILRDSGGTAEVSVAQLVSAFDCYVPSAAFRIRPGMQGAG